MFQTEPILWLQSFASDSLTRLAVDVSAAGNSQTYLIALAILAFAGDLRMALVLAQGLLWSMTLIGCLKQAFDLPRPVQVDANVRALGSPGNRTQLVGGGASEFFTLPRPEVLEYVRATLSRVDGFPSGHASSATVVWGGTALYGGSPLNWTFAAAAVFAISLSRIYLGVHFLADVLGGVVVGSCVLGLLRWFYLRPAPVGRRGSDGRADRIVQGILVASLAVPALLLHWDLGPTPRALGQLTGFSAGLLVINRHGLPLEGGTGVQRIARVSIAFVLYAAVHAMVAQGLRRTGAPVEWVRYGAAAAATLALVGGTIYLSGRLRLYRWSSANRATPG